MSQFVAVRPGPDMGPLNAADDSVPMYTSVKLLILPPMYVNGYVSRLD